MYRQLYQMGGIGGGITQLGNGQEEPIFPRLETLSQNLGQAEQTLGEPSNQFDVSSITTAITGRPPMNMGGIANLVDREKYGLGSSIKKAFKSVAKAIIPKELDPVLKIAAPFLGPVYGPIASIAGSARSGKIDPFSLAAATLPYLQFNPNATGLSSLMPTGYGGSQYGIFGGANVGFGTQGTSLSQMISDKAREFLSPNTPTQDLLKTSTTGYTGGTDALTYDPKTVGQNIYGSTPNVPTVGTVIEGPGGGTVVESLSLPSTDVVAKATQQGYTELIKKAGSLENVPLSERFNAVKDLSAKALTDIYTKPVINPKTGETTNVLDKNSLFATFAFASSYAEARKLADKAGIPESEFSEADYQRLKVQPEKEKYTDVLKPESFGIRPQSANGGLMNGVLSIKLTPAQAMAKGGSMGSEIPVRQNQGGITELDLRAKGGYIPVGIKEKADDVPAMLSKNEFVFTADAVRGAGNGNINKGAQKMYKLMKSLEKKVKKMKKVA